MLQFESKVNLEAEFFLAGGRLVFLLVGLFNWLDEAHYILESNLLYSKSMDLTVNLIQKPPSQKHQE